MALTKATLIDLNSNELILDLDADTSITADTDDTIHFKIAGADELVMTGTAFTPAVADGSALGSTSLEWSDLFLADGAVINFGADQDINITHVADTGLTTNADFTVGDDLFVSGGLIDLKNTGTVSTIKFYCESSNAHAQSLVSAPHSEAASNTLTLPGTGGNARLVSTSSTATLTNKTLTTPVIAEIDSGSTITLDATTDIVLDADGGDIFFKDGGTTFGSATNTSGNLIIKSGTTTAATFSGANVTLAGTVGSGAITSTGIVTGTGFTAGSAVLAEAELELLDGLTAGTAIASKVVTTDANIDTSGQRNLTISGELDAATGDFSGAVDVAGALTTAAITASGIVTGTAFTAGSAVLAEAELELLDGLTAGTAIASKVVTTDANIDSTGMRNLTISGELDAATLDISGAIDVAGTTNLDVVDIDGAVDMASTLQVDGAITTSDGMIITTADNTDTLTLISTDDDTAEGPILNFTRNPSGIAAGDLTGTIKFVADDAGGNVTTYYEIQSSIEDGTDGGEDGRLTFMQTLGGSAVNMLDMLSGNVVFNQDSNDVDFRVESNGNTHMIFVDAGNDHVNIGTATDFGGTLNVAGNGWFKNADNTDNLTLESTDADASNGPRLRLFRNSGSPADNDVIGDIRWEGKDNGGNDVGYAKQSVTIHQEADGDEQSMMQFFVALGGSFINVLTLDRAGTIFNEDSNDIDFRVESNGNANMIKVDAGDDRTHYGGTSYQGMSLGVHNFHSGTTTDQAGLVIGSNSASYANNILKIATLRDQNNSYNFIAAFSGNGSDNLDDDLEFRAKGDGNVLCDESFTGSGADYSEYFEWNDGNSSDVDRVGLSVKLSGNKIVASAGSDDAADIIGVVSGSPVIVGDADGTGTRWTQKYLKDDYGRYLYEEYTVTIWRDEANKTDHSYATDRIPSGITAPDDATVTTTEEDGSTKLLRRKLNPDYNSSLTYVARADRKEWDTVGLVGKLRMKKGQKTGTNWIKLRDISDTVEEWLVR